MQPWENPELEAVREKYCEFAKKELAGDAAARDKSGDFSLKRWKIAADYGILGLCMPKEYGGAAKSIIHTLAAFEGLGEGCRDSGFIYALCNQIFGIQMSLHLFASDALKQKYLPDLIAGKSLAAYGFTEEASGSDAFSMETQAVAEGAQFRLNGKKSYITNAPYSNLALVFAKTSQVRSPFGLTAFLVDLDWEGCSKGRSFEKMGLRTVHMGEFMMDNVAVPKENIVGAKGGGLRVLTESTGYERAMMLATALGPMRRGLAACVERCKTRKQYDKPIGAFQQVSARIANMVMRYKICRQVQYDMASKLGDGTSTIPFAEDAAITKLFISENFIQFEMDAMQIFGVRGYLLEHFAQQDLRDSLAGTIWAGTSETLRNTIAKLAGLPVS